MHTPTCVACAEFKFTFCNISTFLPHTQFTYMRWCIMNWYLSQFWYIIFSCLSWCLHAMSWTICRSLLQKQNENVSHFYCCTNRHLFFSYFSIWARTRRKKWKSHFALMMWIFFFIRPNIPLMDWMECQWLNLLISLQFVISYFFLSFLLLADESTVQSVWWACCGLSFWCIYLRGL